MGTTVQDAFLLSLGCTLILLAPLFAEAVQFETLSHLKPRADDKTQTKAVRDLLERLVKDRAGEFVVSVNRSVAVNELETYELRSVAGGKQVSVVGSTGVAAATGIYYYLKYYCKCHISWSGDQLNVPRPLPQVQGVVRVTTPNRFRYYQNVCTQSYSMVWWDWNRWEREIDWMALQGINLPLAFVGQEFIWEKVFLTLGMNQSQIDDYTSGPAFLAWARMGNIHSWAGPLPRSWHLNQVALQYQILQRMRSLGIIPVLPAFAGLVPEAIIKLFPSVNATRLAPWSSFDCSMSCSWLIDPEDPMFMEIGAQFLKAMIAEYGTDNIYNADTFNEMTPTSSDPAYLSAVSSAIYKSMTLVDFDAIWLMQGWLFVHSPQFWKPPQAEALLRGVPIGKMIVLDLFAETQPIYTTTHSFYGQPFIWCMLHNFGGNLGLFGAIENVNSGPSRARTFPNTTMVGTGLTPEGIEQNDIMYELMNELGWRKDPLNLQEWVPLYAHRRYGTNNTDVITAWQLLSRSIYNCTTFVHNHNRSPLVHRPHLQMSTDIWYNKSDVYEAWKLMHTAMRSVPQSDTFQYDLVDITREAVQLLITDYYIDIRNAFHNSSVLELLTAGGVLVYDLLPELDNLLSSDVHFLLGRWIEAAKKIKTSDKEAELYDMNARNQLTLWGPKGNILDYGNKEWGGLINDYYSLRWSLFVHTLVSCINEGVPFDQKQFNNEVFKVESSFIENGVTYSSKPVGNAYEIASRIFLKYYPDALKRMHKT